MKCYSKYKHSSKSAWGTVEANPIIKFTKVDVYYWILYYLIQNFNYIYWLWIAISAKEGTSAKDRPYPVVLVVFRRELDLEGNDRWVRLTRSVVIDDAASLSRELVDER